MQITFRKLLLVTFLLTTARTLGQAQSAAARDRHVVVISLDGFPAYALRDASVPLPTLRRLMQEGGSAEGLLPVNPTVTWPNHTTIVTGVDAAQHGVLFNGLPVRGGEGKPLRVSGRTPKSELVEVPTIYDAAHAAGLTTAEVAWVAIGGAVSIDWSFAERPQPDGPVTRELLDQGILTPNELTAGHSPTYQDELRIRAASYIIERHRPNLLLLHLLTTDDVQHTYGARTLAAQTALVLADRHVQRVLDVIERAGIRDRTTVFVVSDHGFRTYEHIVYPNVLLRRKGLLRGEGSELDCDAWTVTEGGTAMVYVTRESRREATLRALQDAFDGVPGVARVIWPEEYAPHGYPRVVDGGRMADLVIEAAPGYGFQDRVTKGDLMTDTAGKGDLGTHGYPDSDPDMYAVLVAWGAGIATGSHVGLVPNRNIAATIARLLQINFNAGTPLTELLRP